ncbi:MAG: molybdopterin-dependent oxidoreductase, partial [Nitrososphaerales archaeon]
MWKALRSKNTCKTCALGMGGQLGGMRNEQGRFFELCKKSVQAMAADMQGGIQEGFFEKFSIDQLKFFSPRELEQSGRLTRPLYAKVDDSHYKNISWEDAINKIAEKIKSTQPEDSFFYSSGRSSNEAGFLLQLFARLYGTNNVNTCQFYCHQASTVGLGSVTGSGTATVVLDDIEKADLLILIGGNPASNHPRFMTIINRMKGRGGRMVVVNPVKETGLVRFKIPSNPVSLFFGTKIADEYVQPSIGGDIAFLAGVAKYILEKGTVDEEFVRAYTEGWEDFKKHLENLSWDEILKGSGVEKATIEKIAEMYIQSEKTIFCWAMGITHHQHGVRNVQMIANL